MANRSEVPTRLKVPPPSGKRYTDKVPDTLDLAERANLAVNVLTNNLDPEFHYLCRGTVFFTRPPYMIHSPMDDHNCTPMFAESLALMRTMTGSELNLDIEENMINNLVEDLGEDGLYYERKEKLGKIGWAMQWDSESAREDDAQVHLNGRMMEAMIYRYQQTHNLLLKKRVDKMVEGFARIAVSKGDYAYFPDGGGTLSQPFSHPRSGWKSAEEPATRAM